MKPFFFHFENIAGFYSFVCIALERAGSVRGISAESLKYTQYVSRAKRGGCGSGSRGYCCIIKHKPLTEIKNVFPFGQVTSNALTCPQVKAACLKPSNARTSGGQSAVTKTQTFSLVKHRSKGM